jgi:hypothetical protein
MLAGPNADRARATAARKGHHEQQPGLFYSAVLCCLSIVFYYLLFSCVFNCALFCVAYRVMHVCCMLYASVVFALCASCCAAVCSVFTIYSLAEPRAVAVAEPVVWTAEDEMVAALVVYIKEKVPQQRLDTGLVRD